MTEAELKQVAEAGTRNGDGAPALVPAVAVAEPGKLTRALAKRRAFVAELLARGVEGLNDVEFVHDLRVGSRRLGEVAWLLRAFMDKPTAKAVAASMKSLRRSMGDLRDADVTREHLLKWRMPGAVKKVAREVADEVEGRREELKKAAAGQITSASVSGTMVILARTLEDRGSAEMAEETEQRLRGLVAAHAKKREKQMRQAFGKAARKQTAVSLHEARIAVKKLRYVLELAQDAGERGAKSRVKFLKKLQELLGDHHDTHVILEQVQTHLRVPREKAIAGLAPAFRKWHRQANGLQAKRAAEFFTKTYSWINS